MKFLLTKTLCMHAWNQVHATIIKAIHYLTLTIQVCVTKK